MKTDSLSIVNLENYAVEFSKRSSHITDMVNKCIAFSKFGIHDFKSSIDIYSKIAVLNKLNSYLLNKQEKEIDKKDNESPLGGLLKGTLINKRDKSNMIQPLDYTNSTEQSCALYDFFQDSITSDSLSNWKAYPYGKFSYLKNGYVVHTGGMIVRESKLTSELGSHKSSVLLQKVFVTHFENSIAENSVKPFKMQIKDRKAVYFFESIFENESENFVYESEKMIHPRAGHCAVPFNSILIAASGINTSSCEVMDLETGKWSLIRSLNEQRINACAIIIDDKFLYIILGISSLQVKCFSNTVERIRLAYLSSDTWDLIKCSAASNIDIERSQFATLYNEKKQVIFLVGGVDSFDKFVTDILEFCPIKHTFQESNSCTSPPINSMFLSNNMFNCYGGIYFCLDTESNVIQFNSNFNNFYYYDRLEY